MELAQDRVHWADSVLAVLNIWITYKVQALGIFVVFTVICETE